MRCFYLRDDLFQTFQETCDRLGKPMSLVVGEFMEDFVRRHTPTDDGES